MGRWKVGTERTFICCFASQTRTTAQAGIRSSGSPTWQLGASARAIFICFPRSTGQGVGFQVEQMGLELAPTRDAILPLCHSADPMQLVTASPVLLTSCMECQFKPQLSLRSSCQRSLESNRSAARVLAPAAHQRTPERSGRDCMLLPCAE